MKGQLKEPDLHIMNDGDLMMAVSNGQIDRLGILFERHKDKLFDYFYRLSGDRSLSKDLVQNVFERILKGKHTYKIRYPFLGWMFRIARNIMMDHFRSKKKIVLSLDESDMMVDSGPPDWEESDIERALNRIKPEFREVLILTRYEELKYHEVAEIIGISETGVKSRVHRAMKELRNAYVNITAV